MNFYADKPTALPRFVYRRAKTALHGSPAVAQIRPAIEAMCKELRSFKGDYLKLKYFLPAFLDDELQPNERELVRDTFERLRGKMRDRLKFVYPQCSDEYSLSIPFLTEVLGLSRKAVISRSTKCFTVGSCFARNIGEYLSKKGYNVDVMPQTEDLNSPFSNAALLELCAADAAYREAFVHAWLNHLFPEQAEQNAKIGQHMMQNLEGLRAGIASYDVVIMTLGNNLDFFGDQPAFANGFEPREERAYSVAPKFLSFVYVPDVDQRMNFSKILNRKGFGLRAGSVAETTDAVNTMLGAIRKMNPRCRIFLTVSPVPIDSAVGLLNEREGEGVVQLDCQSKSQLRCVVDEVRRLHGNEFVYFPSYEIVRWIAPMVAAPTFGAEDACSRHVSSDVLQAVYDLFFECYCVG